MKKFNRVIYILVPIFVLTNVALAERFVVCKHCPHYDYQTISDAIQSAQPGDEIVIICEYIPQHPSTPIEYIEHIVIDKPLTIRCEDVDPDIGNPVIVNDFSQNNEIVLIQSSGSGTIIENLDIKGPDSENTTCSGFAMDCLIDKAGIRIEADNNRIENSRITQCLSGIVIGSALQNTGQGNIISNCKIGDVFVLDLDKCDYWTLNPLGAGNIHPGNGFGIVVVEPDWIAPSSGYESITPNEIVDCEIRSNRYYGVILTNGSKAQVNHNLIVFNGDSNSTMSNSSIPDKTGGILSLFTETQINDATNHNKIQSPMIRSNTIYGNKGYQIGVFTGSSEIGRIYNSPVIISNNIGIDSSSNLPSISSENEYNFLICCGPTPVITATPLPTMTPTPGQNPSPTPFPTCTARPPGDFPYNYHGSGPILAWNNYHDETYDQKRRIYHPMQKRKVYTSNLFTPTPAPTINTPTPTPFPSTPTAPPQANLPQGIPWTPPPTPVFTSTPAPGFYQTTGAWEIQPNLSNPQFVGWVTPTPQGIEYFDWHLVDYDMTPNPTKTPSKCYNKGGIQLNPGSSNSAGWKDFGFVDLGRHLIEYMPVPEHVSLTWRNDDLILTWRMPDYYPDGSILDPYDIGGVIVYWGREELISSGGLGGFTQTIDLVTIGNPIFLDGQTLRYDPDPILSSATHMGVKIYSVKGMDSTLVWEEIPPGP